MILFWILFRLPSVSSAAILWVSDPVLPNETLIVQGYGLGSTHSVTLEAMNPSSSARVNVPVTNVMESGFQVLIPENFPPGNAFVIGIGNDSMKTDLAPNQYIVNAPQVQWVLGDSGHESTQSGWIRIFGKCLAFDEGYDNIAHRGSSAVVLRQRLRHAIDTAMPYTEIACAHRRETSTA